MSDGSSLTGALIFFASAVITVPIFQRLGFGSVLGYLVAGVIIGPFGAGWIGDVHSTMGFAEFGVVMLLFVIGLEIQPRKLWSMRVHLLGLGGTQIALTTLAFTLCGWALGLSPMIATVVAFSMSLSSTAFAIQTLAERNQLTTEHGRSSFAVLLMQDLVAIPALAIIPGLIAIQPKPIQGSGLNSSVLGVALILFLILLGKVLIRPLFKLVAKTRSRDIFTATTLLIVLGVAELMTLVGLSAALGSFLAGVLLADSEYRHELEADIEPFKGLLMGLFFIAVGMSVNIQLVLEHPLQTALWLVGYLAIKLIVIYASGRLFRLSHHSSLNMAFSIAQGGEFAFVIFGLFRALNMSESAHLDMLTVIVTLSMAASPFLFTFNERVLQKLQIQSLPQRPFDQIDGEKPDVIIVGFGRFGQIFGRILRVQNIPFIAIDHNSEQIDLVRRFGNKVYYGDAGRLDILEAAGAKTARYLVLAIGNPAASLRVARTIREQFPHLKVFARARNRGHVFDLLDLGIEHVKRETLDGSLDFTRELLVELGYDPSLAQRLATRFRDHDEQMLREQHKVRHDDQMFVSVSRQASEQLAAVLREDTVGTKIRSTKSEVSP